DEIREAVRLTAARAHLVAEPGGAVAVAACLLRGRDLPAARTRVAVLSGGNIDPALLAGILSRRRAGGGEGGSPAGGEGRAGAGGEGGSGGGGEGGSGGGGVAADGPGPA